MNKKQRSRKESKAMIKAVSPSHANRPSYLKSRTDLIWLIGFGVFSIIISLGFFWEGIGADFSSLCGDQINILSVCARKDYPDSLQGDFVVGNQRNVEYYIPAFVNLVRFLSLPDHNYLRGLNLLLLVTSILYLWGWWMLFSIWGDRWIAATLAFFCRGVLWPPGHELWGIGSLWTMLPRTLFIALLPWVLWLWFQFRQSQRARLSTWLLCGLLVNIHPVSGICLVVAVALVDFSWTLMELRSLKVAITRFLLGGIVMLFGASPYICTYFSGIGEIRGINPIEFAQALRMRISPILLQPGLYLKSWLHYPKLLALVLFPWLACLFIPRKELKAYRFLILSFGVFSLGCILVALVGFPAERILSSFGYQVRFAFELVRTGKYVMVPSLILLALLCSLVSRRLIQHIRYGRVVVGGLCSLAVILTLFAREPIFDRVPVLGDDICRLLWPEWVTAGRVNIWREKKMDPVFQWIRENIPEEARFIGPKLIRVASLRPIVHEGKGAAMLIQANPQAFIEWAKREEELKRPEYQDPVRRSRLFASWGADYWLSETDIPEFRPVYSNSEWHLYRLR